MLRQGVTTAIGVPLSQMAGGLTPITTAAIILTGILASVTGPMLCKLFGLKDEISRGVAFGTAGHVIGTSKANELSPLTGAVSSLSLVVAGHFETEDVVINPLKEKLQKKFCEVEFLKSESLSSPLYFI